MVRGPEGGELGKRESGRLRGVWTETEKEKCRRDVGSPSERENSEREGKERERGDGGRANGNQQVSE